MIEAWLQEQKNHSCRYHGIGGAGGNIEYDFVRHGCGDCPTPLHAGYASTPLKRLSLGPDAPQRILGVICRQDSAKTRAIEEVATFAKRLR